MTKRKSAYERIGDRAKRGDYDLVEPFDYLILSHLAEEGTTFAGLYQIGTNVKELSRLFERKVTPSQIGGRLHSMRAKGLVTLVRVMGKKELAAWQRTAKGKQLYEQWKEANGASSS